VDGVQNLLSLKSHSASRALLLFLSSVSSVQNYGTKHPDQIIPESMITDASALEPTGYGESKYISERLLDDFSLVSKLSTVILRTGQIAGPLSIEGSWQKKEWVPSLITSSKYLGVLPDTLGRTEIVDWVAVDVLATIIKELLDVLLINKSDSGGHGVVVYNTTNFKVTTWSSVLLTVEEILGGPDDCLYCPVKGLGWKSG
jgi:thioester reductase-like protein